MLKGKIKVDFMKTIVDATAILVDEAKFKFDSDGMYGRMVDPAHVGMIDFKMKKEAFEEYECDDETEIGIDLEKLKSTFRIATGEDILEIRYDKEKGRLHLRIGNLMRKVSLLDASEMPDTKVPSLDLPAEIVVPSAQFYQAIRAAEAVADHVILMADQQSFQIMAQGDTDSVEMKLGKEEIYSLKCDTPVKSMFPLDYLSDMVKIAKGKSEEIIINLGTNYPVKLSFDAEGYIKIVYLLAPRIEE